MSVPSRTFDGMRLFLHEVSWCQNCFVCAFLCLFSKFFIIFSLHARQAGLPTTPICSHIEEEEKRMTSWLFPFWRLDVSVWMGERIFAVYALLIRNWPTVLRHRAMVSTCRIHGPIFGNWHSLNLCVFSQWKPRFPHGKTDPVSTSSKGAFTLGRACPKTVVLWARGVRVRTAGPALRARTEFHTWIKRECSHWCVRTCGPACGEKPAECHAVISLTRKLFFGLFMTSWGLEN